MKFIDVTGKSEDEAIQRGLAQLGLERDDVSVEVLERAKSGFLGLGGNPARVRISYEGFDQAVPPVVEAVKPLDVSHKKETIVEKKPEPIAKKAPIAPKSPVVEENEAPVSHKEEKTVETEDKEIAIRDFLTGLLAQLDVEATVEMHQAEKGRIEVNLVGENLGALIGRRGETLDAIQQLTSYAINRQGNRVRVQLDAENYRAKREQSLENLAKKVASKVIKLRRNVPLEPMNAYERHVIHTALQDVKGITTYSTGTDPNRRVIVALERK